MKPFLFFALAALAFGCKKEPEQINVSSKLIGTYQMNTGVSFTQNGRITNQTGTGTLKIVRSGSTGNTYEVTEDYGGYYRKYLATVDGNRLTIQNNMTESIRLDNNDYPGELIGTGEATDDTKTIRIRTTTYVTSSGMSFKKVADVLGTR